MGGGGRRCQPASCFLGSKPRRRREAEEPRAAEGPARAPQPIVRLTLCALLQRSPGLEEWMRLPGGPAASPALVQRSRSASDQSPVIMQDSGPISSASS